MKRFGQRVLAGCLWILFLSSSLFAEADSVPSLLEASTLVNAAHNAEKDSYAEAYKYYKAAIEKVEQFASEHPSSDLAAQLVQGKQQIGPYTLKELREVIVPKIKKKADAEVDAIEAILLLIEQTSDGAYRDYALKRIIRIYKRQGQIGKAVEVALTRTRPGERPYFLISLAEDLAAEGKKKEALDLLEKAALQLPSQPKEDWQIEWQGAILTNIALSYIHLKEGDRAKTLLEQALPMVHSAPKLSGLAVAYSALGEEEKAEVLFNKAKAVKRPSDAYSLGLNFAQAGRYEEAGKFLEEINLPSHKMGLLVSFYGIAARRGDEAVGSRFLAEAIEGAKREKHSHEASQAAKSWLKFARQARAVGEMEWALKFLKKAEQSVDAIIGNPIYEETLTSMAEEYWQLGELQRVGDLLDRIETTSHKGSFTWGTKLPEMYARIGRVKQALLFIEKDRDVLSKNRSRLTVAETLWNKGNHNDALSLLTKAESELNEVKVTAMPWVIFERIRLACQYGALGQTSGSLRLLAEAEKATLIPIDSFDNVPVLIEVSRCYITLNQVGQAERVLSKAVEMTEQKQEPETGSQLYSQIASVYADRGLFQPALQAAARIKDDNTKAYAWISIANKQIDSNETAKARDLLVNAVSLLHKENQHDDTEIARAWMAVGEVEEALRLVEGAKNKNEKLGMLSRLLISNTSLDPSLWPRASVARIKSLLKDLETKDASEEDWVSLGALWANLGEHQQAERLFVRAESQTGKRRSATETEYDPLQNIAYDLILQGQPERAISIAVGINDSLQQVYVFDSAIWSLIDQKQKEKAKSFMAKMEEASEGMTESSQRSQALLRTAKKWIELGEREKGLTMLNELMASPYPPNKYSSNVAAGYIEAGERDKGMNILEDAIRKAKKDGANWQQVIQLGEMTFPLADAGETDRRAQRFLHMFLELSE